MAKIVLTMATTHGPQLHTTPDEWLLRIPADKSAKHPYRDGVYTFDELVKLRASEGLAEKSSAEGIRLSHQRCHDGMEKLADKWDEVKPDVAVILGNDQGEVFNDEFNPSFMVFYGDKLPNYPQTEESRAKLPPGVKEAEFGHATPTYTEYDGLPDLGAHIVKTLIANEFDVTASKVWPKQAKNGVSHAFGHIYRQVMRDKVVPNVPIFQNTFFPPNQPTPNRAYNFGKAVRVGRHEPFRHRRRVRQALHSGIAREGPALPDDDPPGSARVRNIGVEVVDLARGHDGNHAYRDAPDRLHPLLPVAGRHRHGECLLLVGCSLIAFTDE